MIRVILDITIQQSNDPSAPIMCDQYEKFADQR